MNTPRSATLLFSILLLLSTQLFPNQLVVAEKLPSSPAILQNSNKDALSRPLSQQLPIKGAGNQHRDLLEQSRRFYVRRVQKEEEGDNNEGLFQLPSEYRTIIIVVIAILALMCFGGLMFCFCCAEMLCSCCGLCDC